LLDGLLRLEKRHNEVVYLPQKSVINMIWLLLPVSDWPIIMIDPGGLLLVVSDLFAVSVFSLISGFAKKYLNN
jgi:hypothetical protein